MMKHGWKTRIDERVYFERKKAEREERAAIMELVKMKFEQERILATMKQEMH